MSKITDLLKEVGKDVLTEESLETIETVFNEAVEKKATERAELATEAALQVQDDEHSKKLEELLEAIEDCNLLSMDYEEFSITAGLDWRLHEGAEEEKEED